MLPENQEWSEFCLVYSGINTTKIIGLYFLCVPHNKFHIQSLYFLSMTLIFAKEVEPAALVIVLCCHSSLCEDCRSVTCLGLGISVLISFVCVCTMS